MVPLATATLAMPLPSFSAFQASLGPSAGHSLRRPVSGKLPSRFGPRHWGAAMRVEAERARMRVDVRQVMAGVRGAWVFLGRSGADDNAEGAGSVGVRERRGMWG